VKIGDLAKRSGCSVATIRFYEKESVLDVPMRNDNGYRSYTEKHLSQLNFIRHCRSLGMGLSEVRILLNLLSHPEMACTEISVLIDSQIERVKEQIEMLRTLEKQLQALRVTCNSDTNVAECKILQNLKSAIAEDACPCHNIFDDQESHQSE